MPRFSSCSEKAAASRFTVYRDVMQHDPPTRAIFEEILHDETFHMNYTLTQLARVAPGVTDVIYGVRASAVSGKAICA